MLQNYVYNSDVFLRDGFKRLEIIWYLLSNSIIIPVSAVTSEMCTTKRIILDTDGVDLVS